MGININTPVTVYLLDLDLDIETRSKVRAMVRNGKQRSNLVSNNQAFPKVNAFLCFMLFSTGPPVAMATE